MKITQQQPTNHQRNKDSYSSLNQNLENLFRKQEYLLLRRFNFTFNYQAELFGICSLSKFSLTAHEITIMPVTLYRNITKCFACLQTQTIQAKK